VRVEIMSSKPKIIINLNLKIGNQIIIWNQITKEMKFYSINNKSVIKNKKKKNHK
jgi:hypothetical protein